MPLIRAKPRDCNANIIWKVQTVWENKMGLKEHKMSSSVGWKIEINSNYWLLKVIMSYALLCLCDMKMSKFYPKWSLCLFLGTSCAGDTFVFPHGLNSPHELYMSSWTLTEHTQLTPGSMTWIISEVRLSAVSLVPFWAYFWDQFGLSSPLCDAWVPLWDWFVLTSRMVWPLLKSNSFCTGTIYP